MQLEAYLITPRIMNKAVAVPGPLVLIGALVGATLFGLLGALVAVPVTASILLILNGGYIPDKTPWPRPLRRFRNPRPRRTRRAHPRRPARP